MVLMCRSVCLAVFLLTLLGCSGAKQPATPAPPPMSIERTYQTGRQAFQAGRFEDAARHFAQVVQMEPLHLKAWNNWGAALSRANKGWEWEAIAKFQHVLRQDPRNAEAHYNWGAALARLGQETEAIEHFQQAIALKPTSELLEPDPSLQPKLQNYLERNRERVQESEAIKVPTTPPAASSGSAPVQKKQCRVGTLC